MANNAEENILGKIDALLAQSAGLPDDATRQLFEDTIAALMQLHGDGIAKMLEKLSQRDGGIEAIDALAEDPTVASLLLVYNLHPRGIEDRVNAALESVRPYIASHGGAVELVEISSEGVVQLRMHGSCHGCPSSALTLKNSIEKAILEKAPDVAAIQVDNLEAPKQNDGFVSLEEVRARAGAHANASGAELETEGALT